MVQDMFNFVVFALSCGVGAWKTRQEKGYDMLQTSGFRFKHQVESGALKVMFQNALGTHVNIEQHIFITTVHLYSKYTV